MDTGVGGGGGWRREDKRTLFTTKFFFYSISFRSSFFFFILRDFVFGHDDDKFGLRFDGHEPINKQLKRSPSTYPTIVRSVFLTYSLWSLFFKVFFSSIPVFPGRPLLLVPLSPNPYLCAFVCANSWFGSFFTYSHDVIFFAYANAYTPTHCLFVCLFIYLSSVSFIFRTCLNHKRI